MSNADVEILPGWNKADLIYLAECLEGRNGEGRREESSGEAARFIRAAISTADVPIRRDVVCKLTPAEYEALMKERARAERNKGD